MTEILLRLLELLGQEATLWLLAGVSTASLAVAVERWWYLRARRVDIDDLATRLGGYVDGGDPQGARDLVSRMVGMEARVAERLLANVGRPRAELEDLCRAAIERERLRYERALGWLATIGSNAPFIGLFGTVLGIVRAFAALATTAAGANRNAVLLGAISEALVATAVGIAVAIPAVVAYNALTKRVEAAIGGSEVLFRELAARISAR